jgi:lipid II:glycine glycyltransferase (peptidoglycan interpeptide bridge formation enzyme)
MKVQLLRLKDLDKEQWNKMAIECSNLCQTCEWAIVNKGVSKSPYFLAAEDAGALVGGWLVFNDSLKGIPGFLAREINIPSEPICASDAEKGLIVDALWESLLRLHPSYIVWLNKALCKWEARGFLENTGFDEIVKYGSYVVDLTQAEDGLWKNLHGKHRNNIRKAQKEGVKFEESEDVRNYFLMSEQTYARSEKKGPSLSFLKKLFEVLNPRGMCRMFFAEHEGRLAAGAVIVQCGERATYLFGATRDRATPGASNLLHWEIMMKLKSEKLKIYDLGGVALDSVGNEKAEGIAKFKERFGGDLKVFWGGRKTCSPSRKYVSDNILDPMLGVPKLIVDFFQRRL